MGGLCLFPASATLVHLAVLLLVNSAYAQDINLEIELILSTRERCEKDGKKLLDIDIDGTVGDRRPADKPGVSARKGDIHFESVKNVQSTSVKALDQHYHNKQGRKSLTVNLVRSTTRSTTVSTQVLRGIRTRLAGQLLAKTPELSGLPSGEGKFEGSVLIDLSKSSTKEERSTEKFSLEQKVTVPPRTITHVIWLISEQKMTVQWTATVYLEGYVRFWYSDHTGQRFLQYDHVCNNAKLPGFTYGNKSVPCAVTATGVVKVEGGHDSHIVLDERKMPY
ncbi:uncharacterized protein LOC144167671 isoform X2 [Haemaphysalis longicornis]